MERINIRYTVEGRDIHILQCDNEGETFLLVIGDTPYKYFKSVKSAERWLVKHNYGRA